MSTTDLASAGIAAWAPGDGWREVSPSEAQGRWPLVHLHHEDGSTQYWIREEPPAPLPTEAGTTIRVTASSVPDLVGMLMHLDPTDPRYPWHGNGDAYPVDSINGFELVARPPLADDTARDLLRVFAMRAFGVVPDDTGLQYGVDLLLGREPIVEQD